MAISARDTDSKGANQLGIVPILRIVVVGFLHEDEFLDAVNLGFDLFCDLYLLVRLLVVQVSIYTKKNLWIDLFESFYDSIDTEIRRTARPYSSQRVDCKEQVNGRALPVAESKCT